MEKLEPEEFETNSSQLVQLFSETMNKRQISFADWYELLAAPLDAPYSADAEDTLNRMIYGVRHGLAFFAGSLTPYLYSNWREMDRRVNVGRSLTN